MGDMADDICLSGRNDVYLHSDLRLKKHHSPYLQRSFDKYGEEGFLFSIIEYGIEVSKLLEREQYYIDRLKPTYNACKTAGSRQGLKASPQTREKLRISHLGHTVSEEYRAVLRERFKGNKIQVGNTSKRKVTPEILKQVEELRSTGLGCRRIAAITGLNKTTILNIFNNKYNYGTAR